MQDVHSNSAPGFLPAQSRNTVSAAGTDATRATTDALPAINRRRFLLNTASAASAVAIGTPVHADEPEMTPREQAIWHMRELERLATEDGAASAAVILSVRKDYDGRSEHQLLMIDNKGNVEDGHAGRLFASKGGAV